MNWKEQLGNNPSEAKRKKIIAKMVHADYVAADIAYDLGIPMWQVEKDLDDIAKGWAARSNRSVGLWRAEEIAFAEQARAELYLKWKETGNLGYSNLCLRWTERLAELIGVNAPHKTEDWTKKDWTEYARAYAEEKGLTEEQVKAEVIAEVESLINQR